MLYSQRRFEEMMDDLHHGNWSDAAQVWADTGMTAIMAVELRDKYNFGHISDRDLILLTELGTERKSQ